MMARCVSMTAIFCSAAAVAGWTRLAAQITPDRVRALTSFMTADLAAGTSRVKRAPPSLGVLFVGAVFFGVTAAVAGRAALALAVFVVLAEPVQSRLFARALHGVP